MTCRINLMDENQDAAAVYMLTRHQVITAEQGRIVGIDINAVKAVMDMMDVKMQHDCLVRVMRVFYYFLENAKNET